MEDTKFHPGDYIGGRYRLLDLIGVGSFSEVWQAEHRELSGKVAAIKLPTDKTYIRELKNETDVQRYLRHENIVEVFDVNIERAIPYFVMEYVEGGDLSQLLRSRGKLEVEEAADIAVQLLQALVYVHRKGVVHRGVNPRNILLESPRDSDALRVSQLKREVGRDGEPPTELIAEGKKTRVVKLSDVGLGKIGERVTLRLLSSAGLSSKQRVLLSRSVAYMSPEQKAQSRGSELDGRADLYSFGVILFEMLTGRLPEDDAAPSDLNPEAPRQIDVVFKRCTAPLEERAKGDDILAELQELAREKTVVLGRDADGDADVSEATTVFISRKPAKMPEGVVPATRRTDPESRLPMIVRREKDGAEMVLVPSGEFLMGSDESENERPPHKVHLDAYYIDLHPVTNAQYRQFVEGIGYREPEGVHDAEGKSDVFKPWDKEDFNAPDQPVVCVSCEDAMVYCHWAGARLPTEAEWEKAARGVDGRRYPWGNDFDKDKCNCWEANIGKTTPVKAHPSGRSPYGCYDMAGNVCEWCADYYDEAYYKRSPFENPKCSRFSSLRVMRGGSWYAIDSFVRCATRIYNEPWYRYYNRGFRCCISAVGSEE